MGRENEKCKILLQALMFSFDRPILFVLCLSNFPPSYSSTTRESNFCVLYCHSSKIDQRSKFLLILGCTMQKENRVPQSFRVWSTKAIHKERSHYHFDVEFSLSKWKREGKNSSRIRRNKKIYKRMKRSHVKSNILCCKQMNRKNFHELPILPEHKETKKK